MCNKFHRSSIFVAAWALAQLTLSGWGSPASWAQEKAAKATAPPRIERIDEAMQGFVDAKQCAGVVTLVAHKGKIKHLSGVGMRDLAAEKPMKPYAMFCIASMTKPITATALMILQEEGKLHIDDAVSKYLPEFSDLKLKDGTPASRPITLRDAVTHTSGLVGSQTFETSLADAVASLAGRPLAFQPGEKWQYSPGLNVAGRVVEVVSGMPFQAFVAKRIFEPLGMKNTTFYPDASQQKRLATLYAPGQQSDSLEAVDNYITSFDKEAGPNPSGGLASTARDLFRFYQMILNGGKFRGTRILSAETVTNMVTPKTGDLVTGFTPGNCWGLGWCIVREPQGVSGMLSEGTFGHGGAFGTQGWVDPKTETIYVLLVQRTKFGNSDAADLRKDFQQAAVDALGL